MERGTYTAASAGFMNLRKLEVVNNNLANLNTTGFKRQELIGQVQTFDQTLAGTVAADDIYARGDHDRTPGVINLQTRTDFSPGPIKNTGNVLDVALRNAKDFFVVNTAAGQQYTRAGDFSLNQAGEIVTLDGSQVQGEGGPITVTGSNLSITENGSVRVNGLTVGKIQVARFEDPSSLQREGGNRFSLAPGKPGPQNTEPDLVTKSLEMSNVSAISSVIDLITANRGFEMYTKAAMSIDALNQTAISQVGRKI